MLWPKLVEDSHRESHTIHPTTGPLEIGWVQVMGESLGQENNLEPVLNLEPIAQFQIFHKPCVFGKDFIERVFA